jgi:serine phosphatase RsbU (regulator of sigma subunit)
MHQRFKIGQLKTLFLFGIKSVIFGWFLIGSVYGHNFETNLLAGDKAYAEHNYELALSHYNKALETTSIQSLKTKKEVDILISLANVYFDIAEYKSSIQFLLYYIEKPLVKKDTLRMARALNKIGINYDDLGDKQKALDYYNRTIVYIEKDTFNLAALYNNIADIHFNLGKMNLAEKYFKSALELFDKIGSIEGKSSTLLNLGNVYLDLSKTNIAMQYYFEALDLSIETKDTVNIVLIYSNLGDLYIKNESYTTASSYLFKALKLAKAIKSPFYLGEIYGSLYMLNRASKNYEKALEYFELQSDISKSISYANLNREYAEMEVKYKIKETEKENMILKVDQKYNKLAISTQRKYIWTLLGIAVLMLVFIAVFYIQRRNLRKASGVIKGQNAALRKLVKEVSVQKEEIKTQRDLVLEQKKKTEELFIAVTDSINYAKRIQKSALPDLINLQAVFTEHFLIYKPKDIVSGDFYWHSTVGNWSIIAVADCTGHGVPGAFMSMLGMGILKEIVVTQQIIRPDQILQKLRTELIKALGQKQVENYQNDGLDISICTYNSISKQLLWSGANIPLWVVHYQESKPVFTEYKPDKMPVGIYPKMDDFTLNTIQLVKGDVIYLASDGFQDQFGGEKDKKFLSKKLKLVLSQLSDKPMHEQKQKLTELFHTWMNEQGALQVQTDDITILGIRV